MKVSWLIEKRVILAVANETLSLTDFVQVNQDVIAHLDDGEPATYLIANFRGIISLPNTMNSLHQITTYVNHPNLEWEVLITDIGFVQFLAKSINHTRGRRSINIVKTYSEAKAILQELDPTLTDLPDSID